ASSGPPGGARPMSRARTVCDVTGLTTTSTNPSAIAGAQAPRLVGRSAVAGAVARLSCGPPSQQRGLAMPVFMRQQSIFRTGGQTAPAPQGAAAMVAAL